MPLFVKMKKIYQIENGLIRIVDCNNFCPAHVFECGQVFRYKKDGEKYEIITNNRKCILKKDKDCVIIYCNDTDYFVNYFDLDRDYFAICKTLKESGLVKETEFGKGIRILKQDPFETIISFIISANNHIPRIKSIIERICENFGQDMGGYFAFPTPKELQKATVEKLRELGCGYRAEYVLDTAKRIASLSDFNEFGALSDDELKKRLLSFKGIGPKVADCIMLFGYGRATAFPVDTWIIKAFGRSKSEAKSLAIQLTNKYGVLSGFAQQYIFYYNRENKIDN